MAQGYIERRPRAADRFTQIPNETVRDASISYRARGVLAVLLSHADGFPVSLQALSQGVEKIDAVRAAVRELERAGYLARPKPPRKADGTWGRQRWIVTETPVVDESVDNSPPPLDSPMVVEPTL